MPETSRAAVDSSSLSMPLEEAMRTQRAVRRLKPDPVDDALVLRLIELATKAPSGSNQQNWEFVVLRDRAVKQRLGRLSPKAHLRMYVSEETVLQAPMVYSPLGLFDCCPTTDGAAAALICRADLARSFRSAPVRPLGIGLAVVSGQPYYRPSFGYVGFEATVRAAEQAYAQAGIGPDAVDFAEVHDCFTITEILTYEDLGFCRRGEGGRFVEEGRASLGGEKPVNPSGGLKSYGHPIGATGVRMIYELVTQLRGQAGERQVQGARVGLAHNLGGPGAVACVSILGG